MYTIPELYLTSLGSRKIDNHFIRVVRKNTLQTQGFLLQGIVLFKNDGGIILYGENPIRLINRTAIRICTCCVCIIPQEYGFTIVVDFQSRTHSRINRTAS